MLNRELADILRSEGKRLQNEGSNKCYAYFNASYSLLDLEDLTREDVLGGNINAKYIGPKMKEKLIGYLNLIDSKITEEYKVRNTNPHKHYTPRSEVLKKIDSLVSLLLEQGVKFTIAGSYRRLCPAVGDIDILIFQQFPDISSVDCEVVSQGEKLMKLKFSELEVDMRSFDPSERGCALLFYTGPRDFNIWLRGRAKREGYKLNEYCLEKLGTGEKFKFNSEEGVFEKLDLKYISPELREQWRT